MTTRRARLVLTLSMVVGAHLVVIWILISERQLSFKSKPGSLQLVWIPEPAPPEDTAGSRTTTPSARNSAAHPRVDRTPRVSSVAPAPAEENNAIHPDWTEELKLAAKNALEKDSAQKKHEFDFAHAYPATPSTPPQFAWNDAAIHRVEPIPGGMLIHLGDKCVLVFLPLPLVGCAIGKQPANGSLFEHMH